MWRNERALVALSRRECLELLRTEQIGRAVFTDRAMPQILPVTYAVLGDDIVLATTSTSRLAVASEGGVLAFEVDHHDPVTRTGWSVVVTGLAYRVVDPMEQARVLSVLDPWAPGHHDLLLRLPSSVLTGRRIEAEHSPTPSRIG